MMDSDVVVEGKGNDRRETRAAFVREESFGYPEGTELFAGELGEV